MIVKIDHIAVSTPKSKEFISLIEGLGYKINFIENDIGNMKIKRRLTKNFSEKHKLTFCSLNNSYSFEIIDYEDLNNNHSYITPVLSGLPDNLWTKENGKNKIAGLLKMKKGKLDNFDLPIYIKKDNFKKDFHFKEVIIETEDMNQSVNFWKNFNFIVAEKRDDYAELEFNSILDSNVYKIYLILSEDVKKPYLDDSGFNCLTFVSNSAKKEREKINDTGFKTTDIESLRINNKELDIFFTMGSQGEIVEVISVKQ